MKKNNLKSVFAALAVSAIAVSATAVTASASNYSDSIKKGDNKEVAYDGSAYVTTLNPDDAATKAEIIIDKVVVKYDAAKTPGSEQVVNVAVKNADKKYNSPYYHYKNGLDPAFMGKSGIQPFAFFKGLPQLVVAVIETFFHFLK